LNRPPKLGQVRGFGAVLGQLAVADHRDDEQDRQVDADAQEDVTWPYFRDDHEHQQHAGKR
jgi:hypothetical protein